MDNLTTTPAQENYIEKIYHMSARQAVKPSMLADSLGVKRASVTRLTKTLVQKGLVLHKSHGAITLTPLGEKLAKAIVRRDECLTRLLVEICGMHPKHADPEVHRLEHIISDEVLLRLEILVDFASSSDDWIDGLKRRIDKALSKTLEKQPISVGSTPVHQGHIREKHLNSSE